MQLLPYLSLMDVPEGAAVIGRFADLHRLCTANKSQILGRALRDQIDRAVEPPRHVWTAGALGELVETDSYRKQSGARLYPIGLGVAGGHTAAVLVAVVPAEESEIPGDGTEERVAEVEHRTEPVGAIEQEVLAMKIGVYNSDRTLSGIGDLEPEAFDGSYEVWGDVRDDVA